MSRRSGLVAGVIAAACLLLAADHETQAQTQRSSPAVRAPVREGTHTFRRYPKSWIELRNQNIVMQQRDYSCGAAALATILRYHWGDNVSEEQLLLEVIKMLTPEEMKDRYKKGLALTDLRRLAVRVGYLATIGRLEFEKLRESKTPLVVGVIVDGFDHFVVYRGTDGYYVYLADPARGNLRTPIPDFLQQWQKNLALVVVKQGETAAVPKTSPLTLRPEEVFLGEVNRLYLRDRLTSRALPN